MRGELEHLAGQLDDPPVQLVLPADAGQPPGELEQCARHLGARLLGLEQHRLLERDRGAIRETLEQAQALVGEVAEIAFGRTDADPAAHAEPGVQRRDRRGLELQGLFLREHVLDVVLGEEEGRLAAVDELCRSGAAEPVGDERGGERVVQVADLRDAAVVGGMGVLEPHRALLDPHQARNGAGGLGADRVDGAGLGDGIRELEPGLRVVGLPAERVVEARVLERDRRMAGEHLEQPQVVLVELADAELRERDRADHALAVPERRRRERFVGVVAGHVRADVGLANVRDERRLARLRDVAGQALPELERRQRRCRPRSRPGPRPGGAPRRRAGTRSSCGSRSASAARPRSPRRSRARRSAG